MANWRPSRLTNKNRDNNTVFDRLDDMNTRLEYFLLIYPSMFVKNKDGTYSLKKD